MSKKSVYSLIGAALFLALSAYVFTRYLAYNEVLVINHGIQFNDPLMNVLPARDMSVFIFAITYGSMITYAFLERNTPLFVHRIFIAYGVLLWFRLVALWLVPLCVPEDYILLNDPFLNNLIYPGDIAADLFFSGHAGLLFVMFFLSKKWIFLILGIVLSIFLMMQRAHYSIDVIAAFPFAFLIVKTTNILTTRIQ